MSSAFHSQILPIIQEKIILTQSLQYLTQLLNVTNNDEHYQ